MPQRIRKTAGKTPARAARGALPAKKADKVDKAAKATGTPARGRGRPPGKTGLAKSSTQRVQAFREKRLLSGGAELSLFLPRAAAVALDIIKTVRRLPYKVAAAEHALMAEAQRLVPSEARLQNLVKSKRIEPALADQWRSVLHSMRTAQESKTPATRAARPRAGR